MCKLTTLLAIVAVLVCTGSVIPDEPPQTGLNDQGFIITWLLLAAIPLAENQIGTDAIGKEQIKDEAKLEPKAGDRVKVGDTELVWQEYRAREYFVDFNDFLGTKAENCVGYAVCYIHADAEMKDITLKVGSDDQAKVYLNGKVVLTHDETTALAKDKYTANVSLRRGVNVLVFKVINEKMDWSGCVRFTTKTAQIIRNLQVTTGQSADQPVKEKREGETRTTAVTGVVKAVDAETNTITLYFFQDDKVAEKTFTVTTGASVVIDSKPGTLAALPTRATITLARFVDHKTAGSIQTGGWRVLGFVKAVDAEKGTITITDTLWDRHLGKQFPIDKGGEHIFTLAKGVNIHVDGKPAKLAELPSGVGVQLGLYADQRAARVDAAGPQVVAFLKAVDAEKNTITVVDTLWGRGTAKNLPVDDGSENTFTVAKDANIHIDGKPGKLTGLPTRVQVHLMVSADHKSVQSIVATGPQAKGVVKAVDAERNTITITEQEGDEKTVTVAKDANIYIDAKPARLAGLPRGVFVTIELCVDQKTARRIFAAGR